MKKKKQEHWAESKAVRNKRPYKQETEPEVKKPTIWVSTEAVCLWKWEIWSVGSKPLEANKHLLVAINKHDVKTLYKNITNQAINNHW